MANIKNWRFLNEEGTFALEQPDSFSYLYFPLANAAGMMSSITPLLAGDAKTGQSSFLLPPVSADDLHTSRLTRNFWIYKEGAGAWSAAGVSAKQNAERYTEKEEKTTLEAGFLWHKLTHVNEQIGLKSEITSFVPCENDTVELSKVVITNTSSEPATITATAAVPIYGRSADNFRDHRHVTSLLHRIETCEYGVKVTPTLIFDEHGHRRNNNTYAVFASSVNTCSPVGFFPVMEDFIGEGGTLDWPQAVVLNEAPKAGKGEKFEGFEAIGAIRFQTQTLRPGEKAEFIVALCINPSGAVTKYLSSEKFDFYLNETQKFWQEKLNINFKTGNEKFDLWMKWVSCEPILRRIYGCSFLPHHDYGRGGRGWRDLWQDCLALLIMEPERVGEMLYKNCAGIRFDGTNATIIGTGEGEFIADRNNIARVWMDHAAWPLNTIQFYIDQSGDLEFLLRPQTYFKDKLQNRGKSADPAFKESDSTKLITSEGKEYKGTVLEHLLIENLAAFYNVGDHGNLRLENADWNDALDMAPEKGESVAFSAMYCGNLRILSSLLHSLKAKGISQVELAEEIEVLLECKEESPSEKRARLGRFCQSCGHTISGRTKLFDIDGIISALESKAQQLSAHIAQNEKVSSSEGYSWLNGYYDNDGKPVEQGGPDVRMTLTGQVFAIMFGVADDEMVSSITKAADRYLYSKEVGGYRLNTNFHEVKMNLGRQFGFAYGHKENGAVFSHMTIMYANALYRRGFVREGYKALSTLCEHCIDFEKSHVYPGIPEYINPNGRGMYHYLTGAASWLTLTFLTEVYGIKGQLGFLTFNPKLLSCQFDENGDASCETLFSGRTLKITYHNPAKLDFDEYSVAGITIDGIPSSYENGRVRKIAIDSLNPEKVHVVDIKLSKSQL